MGLFAGKQGLITGVFNKQSIAWSIAERVMRDGAECGFTYMPDKADDARQKNLGRVTKLTADNPQARFRQPMDVTSDEDIRAAFGRTREEFGQIDFLLHSIAFALPDDLRGDTIDTSREGFKLAMEISAYSLIALAHAGRDVLRDNASILTLTYFGGEKAVPGYNVMGVCKATLDAIVRYLAYDLGPRGIRVNALSAGPLQTISGRGAGVDEMLGLWDATSPTKKRDRLARFSSPTCPAASPVKSCISMRATTSWARPGECWIASKRISNAHPALLALAPASAHTEACP